jgi:hypothetical protein
MANLSANQIGGNNSNNVICGITNKIDEFLNSLPPNAPPVICLTEDHLRAEETRNVNLSQFTLGASF